jgi:hypothetical protein
LTVADSSGGGNISQIDLMFSDGVTNGCHAVYFPQWSIVTLFSADGSTLLTYLTPGQPGTVTNGFCTLNGQLVTKSINGTQVTAAFPITFNAWQGSLSVYAYAQNAAGYYSGWILKGSWTIPTMQDQIIGYVKESPATLNPGELDMSRITLSQAGQDLDPLALRVYQGGDPVTFRIRFGRPNQQVWVQRRAISFYDGSWINDFICPGPPGPPLTGISGHEQDGGCLLGSTDGNGFLEWNGTIASNYVGMTTVQFYLGAQTPDPAFPTTTYGPMNEDNYIGALVYFVQIGGIPQIPVW